MVIAIADIKVKPGLEDKFKAWVAESNNTVSKFDGFVSRRMLRGSDGSLRVMVEFEGARQFRAMRESKEHQSVHRQATGFLNEPPAPVIYEVISE